MYCSPAPRISVSALSLATALAASSAPALAEKNADSPSRDVKSSEIVVLGARSDGYKVDDLTTATRTGTDIMSVPQSIQFVPREVIVDQQIIDLSDTVRNVSGIQAGTNGGNRSESFTIRGFRSSYYAVNSIMLSPVVDFNDSYRDLSNVERIEVLKGPASVLYGRGDPGGLINIVTKQPKFTTGMNFSVQTGSDDFARGEVDITGPIDAAHTLAFRVTGAAQTADTFRDVLAPYRRQFVSGSLLWQPGDRTRVIASATYGHQYGQSDRGIVATPDGRGGFTVNLPRNRFLGEAFATTESRRYELNYRIEHDLTDWLTVRQIGHYDNGKIDLVGINFGNSVAVNAVTGARTLSRTAVQQHEVNHNWDFQGDMVAKFTTLGIAHTFVFGVESAEAYRFRTFAQATLAAINIDTPVYGATPGGYVPRADRTIRASSKSAYVQDQIDIGEHVNLLAGIRFDHVKQSDFGTTEYTSNDKRWSPRFGAVWKPIPQISLFADYTRSFQSNPQPTLRGQPLAAESGEQYEAGIKAEAFQNRLGVTLAVYQLTRSHVAQEDPNNIGFNIDAGRQRSRGIEIDASGTISRSIKLIASGAYTDGQVVQSTDYAAGNALIGVPKWSGSVWLTLEPAGGPLSGFGLGAGAFAVSNRQGDLENDFKIGGYTRLDSSLWYLLDKSVRLSLNVKNLANVYYIESSVSRAQLAPGTGRSFLVSLTGNF